MLYSSSARSIVSMRTFKKLLAQSGLVSGLHRLMSESASPVRLGVAVGVGVLFACTPFFGFQLVLALAAAWLLRLNKVAVAIGTQFSLPPLVPFVVYASANFGEFILHGRKLSFDLHQLRSMPPGEAAKQIGLVWTVGGLAFGLLAGAFIGALVAVTARRVQRLPQHHDEGQPSDRSPARRK